ncbi:family 20 glycosylhydrolase, partial [uncultured Microbacterium sp.]|uniref:family 20 glycosylhydrolase n=1 Tax=uncultured Microbacterium sp. TaxID=191216 RepID=UPI002583D2AD
MTDAALLPRPLVTRVAGTAPWRGVAAPEPGAHGVVVTRHPGAAESYRLRVDESGIEISAADDAGVFYAGRTLAQLATRDGEGWVVPAIEVEDAPRFRHRGFMLDVARHFFPVEVVTALIDRLSDLKLNVLHLHLSDDQGWRLAMATRPLLTERASATAALGDAGGFYTADDYRTIVAHATSRHMTVVPEIDMPGHTHAVGLAYPELVEHPVITDEVRAAAEEFGGGLPRTGVPYRGLAVGFSSLRISDP